ncbi:hypothetical protein [Mesorhizobium sp. ES1-6]|nr:hypothetical protein [Mesorhizobium sp. ES1-6]
MSDNLLDLAFEASAPKNKQVPVQGVVPLFVHTHHFGEINPL